MSADAVPAAQASSTAQAAPTEASAYLLHKLRAQVGGFVTLRRDIHREPELAFEDRKSVV